MVSGPARSEAEYVWRFFGKDAMVLATLHLNVAWERIREITGKHPEDLDLADFMAEEENRQEAILKQAGDDESPSEDELLEDDEDA